MDPPQLYQQHENFEIQRNLLTETLPSQEALNVDLVDEKGISNHSEMRKSFKSSYSVNKNDVKNNRNLTNGNLL